MNNSKSYNILYYIIFALTAFSAIGLEHVVTPMGYSISTPDIVILFIINLLLVLIYSIGLRKKVSKNANVLFTIIHLLFFIVLFIIGCLYNSKLIIPYMHFSYYLKLILINYIFLNIYSIMSLEKNKKKTNKKDRIK